MLGVGVFASAFAFVPSFCLSHFSRLMDLSVVFSLNFDSMYVILSRIISLSVWSNIRFSNVCSLSRWILNWLCSLVFRLSIVILIKVFEV